MDGYLGYQIERIRLYTNFVITYLSKISYDSLFFYCEITRSNISSNLRTPATIITHKILGKIVSTLQHFYQGGWPVKRLGSTQRLSQSFVQQQQ